MTILSVLYLLKLDNVLVYAIIAFILLGLDVASFKFLRNFLRKKAILIGFIFLHIAIHLSLIFVFFIFPFKAEPYSFSWVYLYSGCLFSFYVAKIVFLSAILPSIFYLKKQELVKFHYFIVSLFSVITFSALMYGIGWGHYDFIVTEHAINVSNLFKSNNSIRIVQISDLHLGSFFGNEDRFDEIINKVNAQKPDVVILTGDFVNTFAREIEPFITSLKRINAPLGVYGSLGNHDYGDYFRWKSAKNQIDDHLLLKELLKESNVKLLNNEHHLIVHNEDSIFLAGVENRGEYPYRQEAKLDKALQGIPSHKKVLLLSHDPSFWPFEVLKHKNIALTFSGHTHGMQIGFRFSGKEWSPFAIGKKYTRGWYKERDQLMYINKGLGGSLYPGRVGIQPEISVFVIN